MGVPPEKRPLWMLRMIGAIIVASFTLCHVSSFGLAGTNHAFSSSFVTRSSPTTVTTTTTTTTITTLSRKFSTKIGVFNPPTASTRSTMRMLVTGGGGTDELIEMNKQFSSKKLANSVRKTPRLFKMAGMSVVPVSALLGFAITPSRRIAAHAVGSAITGVAGFIGKTRLDAATEAAAQPAIAQVIIDAGGVETMESSTALEELAGRVRSIQEEFRVHEDDFAEMCSQVYRRYLIGMVKIPIAKTSELKELSNLRQALGLSNLAVGEAHAEAAQEFYRQTCLFTPEEDLEDPEHPDRMSIDKFLFLSERVFRQGGETDEAFKYEMSRIAKAFSLKLQVVLDRVADVAQPFYERALASTRSKLGTGAVNADMLHRARTSLGISDRVGADLHVAAFNEEVKSLLGKPAATSDDDNDDEDDEEDEETDAPSVDLATLKFPDGAMDRLKQLQEVLNLSDEDADYEITLEATDLFQATALTSVGNAINSTISPQEAWDQLSQRQKELCLKGNATKDLVSSIISQSLGKTLEDALTYAKVNNEASTFETLLSTMAAKDVCIDILKQSQWTEDYSMENFNAQFFDPWKSDSACGFISSEKRLQLYRIFLIRSVTVRSPSPDDDSNRSNKRELTDEMYQRVLEMKSMLGISEDDASEESRRAFGPELQKTLQAAVFDIMDDYTPELVSNLKGRVDGVIADYKLSKDFVTAFSGPLYMSAVTMVSQTTPGGIPPQEKMEALDALRDLLMLTKEDTHAAHLEVFGSVYKTSVLEAMGPTGVIRKEFRPPLENLRHRLGVSETACRTMFLEAVTERMTPMVERIVLELEQTMLTTQQLSQKRGKDFGEDYFKTGKSASGKLGLGAESTLMTDIMNLIDFYVENDITEKKEIGTKTVEKTVFEGEEEKTISEEEPDYETVYPVTAKDTNSLEEEMTDLLYRQFVVGGFSPGPQAARYEAARPAFGGILGMTKERMETVTSDIGNIVYENYITQSMGSKGSLDQQDMMYLANLQGKLGLSPEKGEEMLMEAQKKFLTQEANALLDKETITPAMVKEFREKCNSMGLELESDIGISKTRLVRMFQLEIAPGIIKGEITVDNAEILSEVQESLGLAQEEAEQVLEELVDNRARSTMQRINAEMIRGREENCIDQIKILIRLASFVDDGDLGLAVDEANAFKIFNLFEAVDFSEEDPDAVETQKGLLKSVLGLP